MELIERVFSHKGTLYELFARLCPLRDRCLVFESAVHQSGSMVLKEICVIYFLYNALSEMPNVIYFLLHVIPH